MKPETKAVDIDRSVGDFHYKVDYAKDAGSGLSEKTIHYISDAKEDPDWVREFRLRGLKTFLEKPLPTHWASKDLEAIDFDKIRYYLASGDAAKRTWEEVPEDIKRTFERLGIPEQERKFLAGVEAQFDSEAVYSNIKKAVGEQGVIFVGSTEGVAKMLSENIDPKTYKKIPGLGHPIHKPVDPRTVKLFEIARETGFYGKHCKKMEELAAEKKLVLNATGAIGALACELGLDWRAVRGLGVMARAVGLVGHLLEESREPMAEEVWYRIEEEASAHNKPKK